MAQEATEVRNPQNIVIDPAHEARATSAIDAIAMEFESESAAALVDPDMTDNPYAKPAEPAEPALEASPDDAPATPATTPATAPAAPLDAASIASIVAQAVAQAMKSMQAPAPAPENYRAPVDPLSLLKSKPREALHSMGLDYEHVQDLATAEALGDETPADVQSRLTERRRDAEIQELRQELARRDQEAKSQAIRAEIETSARQYVESVKESKELPTVAAMAARNPKRVQDAIMGVLAQDAQVKLSNRDFKTPPMTHAQAAALVEKEWAEFTALSAPQAPAAAKPKSVVPLSHASPASWQSQDQVDRSKVADQIANELRRAAAMRR